MKQSFRSFMQGIIDYAGLFPPASLKLDEAIRNYARYLRGDDAWMLSRFIIPASLLSELTPYRDELFNKNPPYEFSVLGKGTETVEQFHNEVNRIIEQCLEFHNIHGERVKTGVLEIKLPEDIMNAADGSLLKELLNGVSKRLGQSALTPDTVFYEAYMPQNWEEEVNAVLKAIAAHNEGLEVPGSYRYAGFKLRCGGTEAELFPSPKQVAFVLNRARDENVAVKCTAGLHHPVRHFDDSVDTKMHGFLNVFGAAMLGYAHDLNDGELIQILEEENPEAFRFTEEAFSWGDYMVFTGEIKGLREVAAISFGSCSFDEPREDLKMLNLL